MTHNNDNDNSAMAHDHAHTTNSDPLDECPAIAELVVQLSEADPSVTAHIATCRRCSALLSQLQSVREPSTTGASHAPTGDFPGVREPALIEGAITVGEVVTLRSKKATGPLLLAVVISVEEDELRLAALNGDVLDASDDEILLALGESPLGYDSVVQLWNVGRTDEKSVAERIGRVSPALQKQIEAEAPDAGSAAGVAADDARADDQHRERQHASLFMRDEPVSLGSLLAAAERTRPNLDDRLREHGWSKGSLSRLRAGGVDPREVTVDMTADLFLEAGWVPGHAEVATLVALESLREALRGTQTVVGGARRSAHFLHFFKQSGLGNPPTDPDAYVEGVVSAIARRREQRS
jgi:hypothetical protein